MNIYTNLVNDKVREAPSPLEELPSWRGGGHTPSCPGGRPNISLIHRAAWRAVQRDHLSVAQLKVMSAIVRCRSAALGGHVLRCEGCGVKRVASLRSAALGAALQRDRSSALVARTAGSAAKLTWVTHARAPDDELRDVYGDENPSHALCTRDSLS